MITTSDSFPTIPLSQTTKFIVDNRGKTAPTASDGIPLIATNCIDNDQLYPVYNNVRYVSQETYEDWFRSHPEPNDIILTLKGSQNGAACLVPKPVAFAIADSFLVDQVQQTCCPLFAAVLKMLKSRRQLWDDLRRCVRTFVFESFAQLWSAILSGTTLDLPPPR